MDIVVDPTFAAGLVLATVRAAAFAIATPVLPLPASGRLAFGIALGWFLAAPVSSGLGLFDLVGAAVLNVAVGWGLGFVTQVLFAAFPVAGGLLDITSGLGIAALFDPVQGVQAALFNRLFALTAAAFFLTIGGHVALVHGLALSVDRIPLDGGVDVSVGLVPFLVDTSGVMLVAAVELALPALAALFVAEIVIALSSRFAPQANLFILGLPLRILLVLLGGSTVLLLFPETAQGLLARMTDGMQLLVRGMGG